MSSEHNKVLEFNQHQKSDKAPFTNYADLKCIIEKIDGCMKIHLQKKCVNIFHQVFQCLQYLKHRK